MDVNGYGLRVPSLVISPYAKAGYVDHPTVSHEGYLKFIERTSSSRGSESTLTQRIDPHTDGRPDTRPDGRENMPQLGDLMNDFDFSQAPRPPLVLPPFTPHS